MPLYAKLGQFLQTALGRSPSTAFSSTARLTGRILATPRPGDVRLGLFGPLMLALTTCLKADLHGSYAAIQALYRDAWGLTVSTGYLAKVSRVLETP